MLHRPAYQPPAFTPAAFSFAEVDAAAHLTRADLFPLLAGAAAAALLLVALRPILRAVVWAVGS